MKVTPHAAPSVIAKVHSPPPEQSGPGLFSDLLTPKPSGNPAAGNAAQARDTDQDGGSAGSMMKPRAAASGTATEDDPASTAMEGVQAPDVAKAATIPGTGTVFTQGSQDLQNRNVFGFNQLGVFGRYGAPAAQSRSQTDGDSSAPPGYLASGYLQANLPTSSSPASRQDDPDFVVQSPNATAGDDAQRQPTETQTSAARITSPTLRAQVTGQGGPEAAPETAAGAEATNDVFAAPADGRSNVAGQAQRRGSHVGPSLLVSEADDGLSIVARSTDALENYSDLRHRLDDTAAEFGMKISEFQLNGSTSQSPASIPGGPHGNRTR